MEFQAMYRCGVFLLALIFICRLLLSVEGRQLKSVMSNEDHQPDAAHRSVSGKKEVLPPALPTDERSEFDSVAGYKDDFRPTTPGNSPGGGHSSADEDEDFEQEAASVGRSNERQSVAGGGKEDFRPTNPGHSPGAGHAFLSKTSDKTKA